MTERRVFNISLDAAVLARDYFLAEVVASIVVGNQYRARCFAEHLWRLRKELSR